MKRTALCDRALLTRAASTTGAFPDCCLSRLHKVARGTPSIAAAARWLIFGSLTEASRRENDSFSRHDFNVHAAPASGSQLEADGLPRGKILWE